VVRLVTDESARCARFISEHIGTAFCPPYYAFGWERCGKLFAAVLVNQFEGVDCAVSAAGTGWTRRMVRQTGEYIYGTLGCLRMTITTEKPEVVEYAKRLGGEVEGRLRDHFGEGRDATIIGILKKDWRF